MTEAWEDSAIEWGPCVPPEEVRIGRKGSQRWVEWRGLGHLMVSPSGTDTRFWPAPDADAIALQKFRKTSLIACERYLTGKLCLHGSAVRVASGAMVLVGEAGAGKSTTAMALVERTGATFLADDIVPVDWQNGIALVPPIDDHFWLTADSAAWFGLQVSPGRKLPHAPRERATSAEALRAVVHLAFDRGGGSVSWEELKGQEKFMVLSRAQVCYSTFEEDDTLRNLEARALLAASVPVFRLRRPRDMAGLTTIAKALQESVATLVRRVIP